MKVSEVSLWVESRIIMLLPTRVVIVMPLPLFG